MNWFVYRLVIKGENPSKKITFTKRAIKLRVSYFSGTICLLSLTSFTSCILNLNLKLPSLLLSAFNLSLPSEEPESKKQRTLLLFNGMQISDELFCN